MTKTTKIILTILTFFVLLAVGLFVFYSYTLKSDNQVDDFDEFADTYIFGRPTGGVVGDDRFGLATTTDDFIDFDKEVVIPKLRKISDLPVAGFISFEDEDDVVSVRYTERSTGHIYEVKTNSLTKKRVSNTTIPRVQESIWVNEDSTIIRYLDENDNIKSFYAEVVENKDNDLIDGKTEGVFLVDNMKEVISLGSRLFYVLEGTNDSQGFTSTLKGEGVARIFSSPLKEWLVGRPKQGTLTLTTKPSSDVFGYLYFLNTSTGRMDKKLSVMGLTTLTNSNLSSVLFSRSSASSFSLSVYDVVSKESEFLPIDTLPEKCVWSDNNINIYCGVPNSVSRGDYPDEWYQGVTSFSDNISRIDTREEVSEILVSPNDVAREEIDLIKPALGPNEDYLFFINKKDLSLWSLELE